MDHTRQGVVPGGPGLTHYTGYLLRRAYAHSLDQERACLQDETGMREVAVLATLHHHGTTSQRELGDLLRVNRSVMVKVVDGLEGRGWVVRERNPEDRRSYALRITAPGVRALEGAWKDLDRLDQELMAGLDAAERVALAQHLRTLLGVAPVLGVGRLGERTSYLLTFAHQSVRNRAMAALGPLGIDTRDFGILSVVSAEQPCSRVLIASRIGVTPPAVQRSIDGLVSRGLLQMAAKPGDRREHALELTKEGRRVLAAARRAASRVQADVTRALGESSEAELRSLLTKLIA
ncbi:MAG: MarR family winged helix-turn-helix transcriptional regulator [Nocardioidaceae bacterium]